jgi:excinuclease ABC subunit C
MRENSLAYVVLGTGAGAGACMFLRRVLSQDIRSTVRQLPLVVAPPAPSRSAVCETMCSTSSFTSPPFSSLAHSPPSLTPSRATGSLWEQASAAPPFPGVYIFRSEGGSSLYVGKAVSLRNRVRSYLMRSGEPAANVGPRIAAMVRSARSVEFVATGTEAAALALEASLVREHRPPFNVMLKDDRRYPYVVVTHSEEYPRVLLIRNASNRRHPLDRLYGPYVDEGRIKAVLRAIHTAYPLRQRARPLHRSRPCSNFDLGLCPGACQRLISPEEYQTTIAQVEKLLSGRGTEVVELLKEEMTHAAATRDFEHAGVLRDRRNVILDTGLLGEELAEAAAAAGSFADPMRSETAIAQDIVACAADEAGGMAKVALFQVRSGCVIGRLAFTLHYGRDERYEAVGRVEKLAGLSLMTALIDYYSRVGENPMELPAVVVLATAPTNENDSAMLAAVLSTKRGKAVRVIRSGPQTRQLAAMVVQNAEMELELDQKRCAVVTEDLRLLRKLLVSYFADDAVAETFQRIECYDISHTSGTHAVGSMAVLNIGVPAHAENRVFVLDGEYAGVSTLGQPDDFASIAATLTLRLASSSPKPDLIVIDGGKGQLSAAVRALRGSAYASIPIVSLAKRAELVFVPSESEAVNEGAEIGGLGVRVLCRARDEAHRAAVGAHVRKRGRAALASGLDGIPGVGPSKRAALLAHFRGGAAMIAIAHVDEVASVPGIGESLARRIAAYFAAA